ncbi:hypothetical protein LCGC14_1788170 [marine sediment metagenome]|uniref:Uncharacterized protein n=1 Tax=marine sediment metagenome TaxID=412755 RepID=A0A0F9GTB3_9ZZZZ
MRILYSPTLGCFVLERTDGPGITQYLFEEKLLRSDGIVGDKTESLVRVLKQEPNTFISLEGISLTMEVRQ